MTKATRNTFNYKLFLVIFATLLIPTVYQVIRMHIIGTIPNTATFSTAANMQWIGIIFEILNEAFVLPLFFIIHNLETGARTHNRIVGKIYTILGIYLLAIVFAIVLTNNLVSWLSPHTASPLTTQFIRLEIATQIFILLTKISVVILIAKSAWQLILITLICKMVLTIVADTFVVANHHYSLRAGILGIGINDLVLEFSFALIFTLVALKIYKFKWSHFKKPIMWVWDKGWQQNLITGVESLFRNLFFTFFVIKTVGRINNSGDFWVMNTFVWEWLMMPIFALSQYMNRDAAYRNGNTSFKARFFVPFIIVTVIVVIWLAFIPTYSDFIRVVVNNPNYELIAKLAKISVGFYVIFAFNEIIDKTFYGEGKAQYMLVQSIVTNIVVYLPFYYLVGNMTIEKVAIMMATSILIDSLITIGIFAWWWRRKLRTQHGKILT